MLDLEKKVSLYTILLLLFVGVIVLVLFGASVRHVTLEGKRLGVFGEVVVHVAEFPSLFMGKN